MLSFGYARNLAVFFLSFQFLACGTSPQSEDKPQCLGSVNTNCSGTQLTFNDLYTRIFSKAKCAAAGGSCHSQDGQKGDLVFADPDDAYSRLMGKNGARARVKPGDPACSELVVRLDSAGHPWSMPPGQPLAEEERCAVRRWIKDGALR